MFTRIDEKELKSYIDSCVLICKEHVDTYKNAIYANGITGDSLNKNHCVGLFDFYWPFKCVDEINYIARFDGYFKRGLNRRIVIQLILQTGDLLRTLTEFPMFPSIDIHEEGVPDYDEHDYPNYDNKYNEEVIRRYIDENLEKLYKKCIVESDLSDGNNDLSLFDDLILRYYIIEDILKWLGTEEENIYGFVFCKRQDLVSEYYKLKFKDCIRIPRVK